MKKRKVLAVTGIRSDYDLMSSLYKMLNDFGAFELKLIVAGAHLSETYGKSVTCIERDNLSILLRIESLIDSNSPQSRLKSASIFLQNSVDIVAQYNPDVIIYAGDREDVIIGALLGGYLGIPTIHFYGGDHVKDGHIDNPVRHATSKLSTYHFVSTEVHKQRLMKMGEPECRIFVTGSPALDKFVEVPDEDIEDILNYMGISNPLKEYALMIFHPINNDEDKPAAIFENILKVLERKKIKAFVGSPNVDPGSKDVLEMIDKYSHNGNFVFYRNINREKFVNLFRKASFIIGNSSCGILEAASIPIPCVNVGKRQTGRYAGENVIFCGTDENSIADAIDAVRDSQYRKRIATMSNPYGKGDGARRAFETMLSLDFGKQLIKYEDPLDE